MQVPLSWLRDYVDINLPVAELAERLTLAGLEVTALRSIGDWWDPETITVGQVTAVLPHPDADRLVLVDVDYGDDAPQRVVTGAPNLFAFCGQSLAGDTLPLLKVAFAREGALLVDAYSDARPRPKKMLKATKIRGVRSAGMVCSERELGLSEEHEGIMLLAGDAPVGAPLRDYLGDVVIEIDLTPDMARALGMIGVAREVAALTGASLHLPPDVCETSDDAPAAEHFALRIDEPELCNRYAGLLIKDVVIGPSPQWMQDRLRKAGMRPISNVVDITNYVMLEWGQPLHAFDYDVLAARAAKAGDATPTIIVRTAGQDEKFTTLDGAVRVLDDSMLLITDTAGPIAVAGVMGGLEGEVGETTRNVLLEAATFEGINNRRTAQKLRIPSEASYRFARGVPATLNPIAGRRAAELMR
ncbi:MAG: phenylalanine--tRNA ligase subunit beta, partial [Chloroflexota bacterium]|nr:phenylalanine--tRNA ligase subunit beta [Chloroflexota bacterium]